MTPWSTRTLHRLRGAALAAVAAVSWAGVIAADDALDVLRRPAMLGARAATSAMLGIARAGDRLVAVGERGIVLLSDDNGSTWRQAATPVSVSLTAVCFADARRGWTVGHGGIVLSTGDGGATWTRQLDGVDAARLARDATQAEARRLDEANGEHGRKVLADAERLVADGPDKPFLDVYFFNADRGIVVGAYGLAFRTRDGGRHWQSFMDRLPNPRGNHLYRIVAAGRRIFIVGEQGLILRSDDDGESWAALQTPYAGTWFGGIVPAGSGLIAFGLRGNAFLSADGAGSWQKVALPTSHSLVDRALLADRSFVLVDDQGQAFRSTDPTRADSFQLNATTFGAPVTGVVQAADGSLVASSLQGMRRVSLSPLADRTPVRTSTP